MSRIIYLKTDRFEVKLEGITFKARDFESLCALDFLFPDGKFGPCPPVVGFDIIRHPRDHKVILLLLCIGVGCLIIRFHAGDSLPNPILKFLTDERIRFVGFGIPRKSDIFPYEELGLTRRKSDIGYLAATRLNDSAYKRSELKHLARKVLGIKSMIGITDASSFERHEHIKCVMCQLFITSVIGMALLKAKDKKKLEDSPLNVMSFLKSFNSLHSLSEGWLKLPRLKKDDKPSPRVAEKRKNAISVKMHPKDTEFDNGINTNVRTKDLSNAISMKMQPNESKFDNGINMNVKTKELSNAVVKMQPKESKFDNGINMNVETKELRNAVVKMQPKESKFDNGINTNVETKELSNVVVKMQPKESKFDNGINMNLKAKELSNAIRLEKRVKDHDWIDGIRLEKQDNMGSFINDISINDEIKVDLPEVESTSYEIGHRTCVEDLSSGEFTFDECFGSPSREIKGVRGGFCPSLNIQGREYYSSDDSIKDNDKRFLKGILKCESSPNLLDQMESMSPVSSSKELTTPIKGILKYSSSSRLMDQMEIMSPISSYKESTTPVKGILKCPSSSKLDQMEIISPLPSCKQSSTPASLRRANSKGLNVSFAFKL